MVKTLISLRRAHIIDAPAISQIHDASWRDAYRGLIPGRELEQLIAHRGPKWWEQAIGRGSRLSVLEFQEKVVGYASYGRNRVPSLPYEGEIFEFYLAPEYKGLGFGERMFNGLMQDMVAEGYDSILIWVLAENIRAHQFFMARGGALIHKAQEKFGQESRERFALGFHPT